MSYGRKERKYTMLTHAPVRLFIFSIQESFPDTIPVLFTVGLELFTVPIDRIISVKNARAWVSMDIK